MLLLEQNSPAHSPETDSSIDHEERIRYVEALREQHHSSEPIIIGRNFIPSCLLSEKDRHELIGVTDYRELRNDQLYKWAAHNSELILHPMDAGLGMSIKRAQYLDNLVTNYQLERPFQNGTEGAKSQDLYFLRYLFMRHLASFAVVTSSIADLKINRALDELDNYGALALEVMVSRDSEGPMKLVYEKFKDELEQKKIKLSFKVEEPLPMFAPKGGELRKDKTAPGGHGYAGRLILEEVRTSEVTPGRNKIHVIYNGDGPNNYVSPEMVGFVQEKKIAFAMVTTTRTNADRKSGCIGVKTICNGKQVPAILEIAQVAERQETLFSKLGVDKDAEVDGFTHEVGTQYFNTNTVLMNEDLLREFLNLVHEAKGQKAYDAIVAPEAMIRTKTVNGEKLEYAEGALGSLVLRLNEEVQTDPELQKIWKEVSGNSQFLQIINLDEVDRDQFFTPVKNAIDHLLYAYTDHYGPNKDGTCLVNHVPGHHPRFEGDLVIKDSYYADMQHLLDTFAYSSMGELDSLIITGEFICKNAIWRGNVELIFEGEQEVPYDLDHSLIRFHLGQTSNPLLLENVRITVDRRGILQITKL